MAKINGRAKGAKAELVVAKLLKSYWDPFEPAEWKRTPMSGGWGGSSEARLGFSTAGDIVTTAKLWPYSVEVKHRQKWSLENVYACKPSPVWGWWNQACCQAAEANKRPLLFFRKNLQPWLVMMRVDDPALSGFRPGGVYLEDTTVDVGGIRGGVYFVEWESWKIDFPPSLVAAC